MTQIQARIRNTSISETKQDPDTNQIQILTEQYTKKFKNVISIEINGQVQRLQTKVRDRESTRQEFCFACDRLARAVIEAGLDLLPVENVEVTTPGGNSYSGFGWTQASCGVSIIRSGEIMEQSLRNCCRGIRIGKILAQTDEDSGETTVVYAKMPPQIHNRIILF